jgi:hypothetical protein
MRLESEKSADCYERNLLRSGFWGVPKTPAAPSLQVTDRVASKLVVPHLPETLGFGTRLGRLLNTASRVFALGE